MPGDTDFLAEYDVRRVDYPGAHGIDYVFTDGDKGFQRAAIIVEPWSGPSWTGSFCVPDPLVRTAISEICSTPNLNLLCVVEDGVAFLLNVLRPADYSVVRTDGPVVGVERLIDESCLLLLTPWSITAVGKRGVLWTSRRLAIEGIRTAEVADGWLHGVADPADDEPRSFAIDLRTGRTFGGINIT